MQYFKDSAAKSYFLRKPIDEELELLLSDEPTFPHTLAYVDPLIRKVLDRFALSEAQYHELQIGLQLEVPIAANRYLHNKRDITGSYPFSTYFTWYIAERLNANGYQKKE